MVNFLNIWSFSQIMSVFCENSSKDVFRVEKNTTKSYPKAERESRIGDVLATYFKMGTRRRIYERSDRYKILHMTRQLCCHGMSKILWQCIWYPNRVTPKQIFRRVWITMEKSFMKRAPDLETYCSDSKYDNTVPGNSWLRHQMETFSTLLALCAGNSPVTSNAGFHFLFLWC